MRDLVAGALGGVVAGIALSAVMVSGRRARVLRQTLAERSEDWLDETFGARRVLGEHGTTALEQANHLAASAMFGAGYGMARPYVRAHPIVAGAVFGAGLYAVNIGAIALLIGLTRGEWNEAPAMAGQRLAMHVFFGVATALATEALASAGGCRG